MPELPEVETTRQGVLPHILNQTISHIIVRCSKLRFPISDVIKQLTNQTILSVERRAKYLLLQVPQGWISIHLGMSGHLSVLLNKIPAAGKHDHIDLCLQNGTVLRYTDPRRFGSWTWSESLNENPLLMRLGPEPLSDAFNADYLYQLTQKRKIKVKPFIMNSNIVVGVGNIYASESLFVSRILPYRTVNTLTKKEVEKLVLSIKQVIDVAIKQGGTTLKDFIQPDGQIGYFAQDLQVYQRTQLPCLICTTPIQSLVIGKRNTFFCSQCQQ